MVISTVLGPATILLMMAGAFTVVFKTGVLASYALALVPAILFILICVFGKTSTQMTVATIMSAAYAIVMTIVLVATVGQAIEGGFTSPNVVFMIMLVVIFLVSAVFHPAEFFCIIPGALYFICLPTGYLLLPIYFLCNMNIVSWGTREVPKRKTKEEIAEEKRLEEEKRRKKEEKRKGIFGWIGVSSILKEMADAVRQLKADTKQGKSKTDALLEDLIIELRSSKQPLTRTRSSSSSTMTDETMNSKAIGKTLDTKTKTASIPEEKSALDISREWIIREDPKWPAWLQSQVCGEGPIKELSDKESIFWEQIIAKYLHPINEDRSHQEKVTDDLKNLRNNVVFGFFMSSALWVALSIQLQVLQEELKDSMFFKIPRLGYDEKLAFEPLGLFFLAFFAGILCIQFIGMFAHRWGTVLHMLSITEVSCGKTFTEKDKVRDIISKAMELQKLCNIENEPEPDYDEPLPDYDFSEDEDGYDTTSIATAESMPVSFISFNPPSYRSSMPIAPPRKKRNRKEIFNTNGFSTGAALRRAFEKRFRNENQGQIGFDLYEEETASQLVENIENDRRSSLSFV